MNLPALDLPQSAFPFDVYAYPANQEADENPTWHLHIDGPGVSMIPSIREVGFRVRIVICFADGTESRT